MSKTVRQELKKYLQKEFNNIRIGDTFCKFNIEELTNSKLNFISDLTIKGFQVGIKRSGTGMVVIVEFDNKKSYSFVPRYYISVEVGVYSDLAELNGLKHIYVYKTCNNKIVPMTVIACDLEDNTLEEVRVWLSEVHPDEDIDNISIKVI